MTVSAEACSVHYAKPCFDAGEGRRVQMMILLKRMMLRLSRRQPW